MRKDLVVKVWKIILNNYLIIIIICLILMLYLYSVRQMNLFVNSCNEHWIKIINESMCRSLVEQEIVQPFNQTFSYNIGG